MPSSLGGIQIKASSFSAAEPVKGSMGSASRGDARDGGEQTYRKQYSARPPRSRSYGEVSLLKLGKATADLWSFDQGRRLAAGTEGGEAFTLTCTVNTARPGG